MLLLDVIKKNPVYHEVIQAVQQGKVLPGLALPRAARLPLLSALYSDLNRPILYVTDRADHAISLLEELAFWLPDVPRYCFAEPTPLFYEDASWGSAIRLQRLQVLTLMATYQLPFTDEPGIHPIIFTSPRALMTKTISRRDYLKAFRLLTKGGIYYSESLVREWIGMGYSLVDTVLEPGQFCRRGRYYRCLDSG